MKSRHDVATVALSALVGALVFSLGSGGPTRADAPKVAPAEAKMLGTCRISAQQLPAVPLQKGKVRLLVKLENTASAPATMHVRVTAQQLVFSKAATMSRNMSMNFEPSDYQHRTFVVEVPPGGEASREIVFDAPAGSNPASFYAAEVGALQKRVPLISLASLLVPAETKVKS
ncbi:MAG: hypothetical protein ACYTGB_08905 [Planctomycetota bacterium]|jgi:hypothetical protein